jgi:hypothetical protein
MKLANSIKICCFILAISLVLSCQYYEDYQTTKSEVVKLKNEMEQAKAKIQSAEDVLEKGENYFSIAMYIIGILSAVMFINGPLKRIARRLLYPYTTRKAGVFDEKRPRE